MILRVLCDFAQRRNTRLNGAVSRYFVSISESFLVILEVFRMVVQNRNLQIHAEDCDINENIIFCRAVLLKYVEN